MRASSLLCSARLGMLGALGFGAIAATAAEAPDELLARLAALERRVSELETALTAAERRTAPGARFAASPADGAHAAPIQEQSILPNARSGTRFSLGGFIKTDANFTRTPQGEIPDGTVGRDFFLPGTIPIGAADEGIDLDVHAKQSRLIFGTDATTADGTPISTRVEIDFYGSITGDQRSTNTYAPVLRHAYLSHGRWLIGQTWSNFQDLPAMPDAVDLVGPTDGTVFVRQPQLRYTRGPWTLSLENPETTLTPFGGGARIASDDSVLPDLVLRHTWTGAGGHLSLAALGRHLLHETAESDDVALAWAVQLSGKWTIGADDLRFALTHGRAIGRYVGLNFHNDAVLDAAGDLHPIRGTAGYLAYRHGFGPSLRGNLILAASHYDNDRRLTGGLANRATGSLAVNLIHTLGPKLEWGIEFRYAERAIESGAKGSLYRLQLMAKYGF